MYDHVEKQRILREVTYVWTEAEKATITLFDSPPPLIRRLLPKLGVSSGKLAALPTEISQNILTYLDPITLECLRSTSSYTKDAVESLPAFREVTKYVGNVLRAMYQTDVLSKFSVNHIYATLCDAQCANCADSGQLLFLPTCSRCCYECLGTQPRFSVVPVPVALSKLKMKEKELRNIPILRTIPGYYFLKPKLRRRVLRLVSEEEAAKLGKHTYGKGMPSIGTGGHIERWQAATACPWLNTKLGRLEQAVCCHGCEYDWYMAYESRALVSDTGECLLMKQKMNTVFYEEAYIVHYETCQSARILWSEILRGQRSPDSERSTRYRSSRCR